MRSAFTRFILWLCLWGSSLGGFAQQKSVALAQIKANYQRADRLANQQQYQKALLFYRQSQRLSRQQNELLILANIYGETSIIFLKQSLHEKAIAECRTGVSVLPATSPGRDTTLFKLYYNLGLNYLYLSRSDSAQYYFAQIETMLEKTPGLGTVIPINVVGFYILLGYQYDQQADYAKEIIYFQKALRLAQKYRLTSVFLTLYSNIGAYHQSVGNYKESIEFYKQSLKYTTNATLRSQYIITITNIGNVYLELKDYPNALRYLHNAYNYYQKLEIKDPAHHEPATQVRILINLGICYTQMGRFGVAEDYLQEAVVLATTTFGPQHEQVADAYVRRGEWQEARGHLGAALIDYQHAINALYLDGQQKGIYQLISSDDGVISSLALFDALHHKAAALHRRYQKNRKDEELKASQSTYQTALQLSEKIRRSYERADAKLFFTNKVYPVYEQALGVTYELYQLTRKPAYRSLAFNILEQSKAATLSDALRDARIKPATLSAKLLSQEKEILRTLTTLKTSLTTARSEVERRSLKSQLDDTEIKLSKLLKQFERESPRYYQSKYANETIPLYRLQAALPDEQTALISYFLGSKHLYVFVASRNGIDFQRRAISPVLHRALAALRQALYNNPGLDIYKGSLAAQQVYREIIAPLQPSLTDMTRLIILRDAELHFIPYEVLEPVPKQYLIQKYTIHYAYSATMLFSGFHGQVAGNDKILAIAPYADSTDLPTRFRSRSLGTLPASRREVLHLGGHVLLDSQATKAAFLDRYQRYGILHLATHARADGDDPAQSYIAFFPERQSYKLYTSELYNLKLDQARLVILSACETGSGRLQRGEGAISLARAFMYAGCPSVVTTLWNAHDESTAYLAQRLHSYLRDGLATDEALRQAKLDYVRSEENRAYDHPYYWANFILIGEGKSVYERGWLAKPVRIGLLVTGGLLALAALTWYTLRRRKIKG
ncbi:MAG: CHAT domain-containing protein [Cytophagaceae bacterium]|nr:CHAT domain-containing protein [Cytophagaceae bacterium]